jgi:hypothetical protein
MRGPHHTGISSLRFHSQSLVAVHRPVHVCGVWTVWRLMKCCMLRGQMYCAWMGEGVLCRSFGLTLALRVSARVIPPSALLRTARARFLPESKIVC